MLVLLHAAAGLQSWAAPLGRSQKHDSKTREDRFNTPSAAWSGDLRIHGGCLPPDLLLFSGC
eukprot:8929321-Alexandrium_andersonii.AAC.1